MRASSLSLAITRLAQGSAAAVSAAWSPLALWPLGASSPGMWTDPPTVASMYQDSAGTTAISAIGTVLDTSNPVGLVLDRKGGLATGANKVTNGTFDSGVTGWVAGFGTTTSTFVASGGKALLTKQSPDTFPRFVTTLTGCVVGRTYKVQWQNVTAPAGDLRMVATSVFDGTGGASLLSAQTLTQWTFVATATTMYLCPVHIGTNGTTWELDNISVREIPGIHLSQATATSRPVASSRVNLLTKSEVFSDASVWAVIVNVSVSTNTTTAPDGATTADTLIESSATGPHFLGQSSTISTTGVYTISCYAKKKERSILCLGQTSGGVTPINSSRVWFDLNSGTVGTASAGYSGTITNVGNGWYRCTASATFTVSSGVIAPFVGISTADNQTSYAGDGTSGLYIWGAQLNLGSTAPPYQRVNTASDYDASAGPTYLKFDGVDDGWSSATFPAGTLTSSMDCLIAVRRDSAANAVCGLYQSVADANKVFGIAESGSGSGCVGSGAGTPTVLVDGTQLTGGTAVTRGTLHTALTPGDWHILEFRNLDLSTWTAAGFGKYTSYILNGALGETLLFPSGQDANRDLARAQMAAYFGVTLP